MKIVLFGYSYHPYTLDILEALDDLGITLYALVEAQPKYSMNKVSNSSDIDTEFLGKVKLKNLISFWTFKNFISNPIKCLKYIPTIYHAKRNINNNSKNPIKHVKICKVKDHTDKKCEQFLKQIKPDLIILGPSSSIIRPNILNIPKIGMINAHMGLLPQFRGMNALEWTLFHLEKACVTIHFVDAGLDTGDIINTYEFPIKNKSNVKDLRIVGRKKMAEQLAISVKNIQNGDYCRTKQIIGEGKQYFSMHNKLIDLVNLKLSNISKSELENCTIIGSD